MIKRATWTVIFANFLKFTSFLLPLLSVILLWEIIVDLKFVNPSLLPAPSTIILTFLKLSIPDPIIFIHIYKSFYRLIIGYSLAMCAGIALGLLMGTNRFINQALFPIISLLIPLPTLAWVPLLLITLGIGDKTIVLAIFLGGFFPMVYNTMSGVKSIKKEMIWASQIMGADKMTIFFKVLLPGSLVYIIAGSRLAIGYSWRALVGAEMLAATEWGVGYLIYASKILYAVEVMFVGLAIIALGGFLMDQLIMGPLEKKTIEKWGMIIER
ncbi:MAG: ABC transporter permease [Candidatus Hydrothermarchaeota archaeon]